MAVQWLGCCVSNVGDEGLIHGQGIKTSHAVLCSQKNFLIKKKACITVTLVLSSTACCHFRRG